MYEDKNIIIEGARIVFRNFAGKEGPYNREGDRNFAVLLDLERAAELEQDGWNVKWLKAREPGDVEQPYLPVAVSYKIRKPTVLLLTARNRTSLDEEDIDIIDIIDIDYSDMIIHPSSWAVNGKSGIKAYLTTIAVRIREDYLMKKYADLEELPMRAGRTDDGEPLAIEAGGRLPFDYEGEVV